ncbi:MAG: hypothetical protein ACR2HE_03165, partial [Casimicrobiaceae bacterium]
MYATYAPAARFFCMLIVAAATAACTAPPIVQQPREALPITPPGEAAGAAVVRRPLPEPVIPPLALAPPTTLPLPAPPAEVAIVVPPDTQYVCVSDNGGQRQQTSIRFSSPKVIDLCKKHPEMGPCQYERDICRRSGGRV